MKYVVIISVIGPDQLVKELDNNIIFSFFSTHFRGEPVKRVDVDMIRSVSVFLADDSLQCHGNYNIFLFSECAFTRSANNLIETFLHRLCIK